MEGQRENGVLNLLVREEVFGCRTDATSKRRQRWQILTHHYRISWLPLCVCVVTNWISNSPCVLMDSSLSLLALLLVVRQDIGRR